MKWIIKMLSKLTGEFDQLEGSYEHDEAYENAQQLAQDNEHEIYWIEVDKES